ncbi:MAG: hypothetical protein ACP5EP_11955 [Acidobacteriaceae bacterium]
MQMDFLSGQAKGWVAGVMAEVVVVGAVDAVGAAVDADVVAWVVPAVDASNVDGR